MADRSKKIRSAPAARTEHELGEEVWAELRPGAIRRLRARLRGFSREEIEDTAQEVLVSLLWFIRRNGLPLSLPALTTVLCQRRADDAKRHIIRDRRVFDRSKAPDIGATAAVPDPLAEALEIEQARDECILSAHASLEWFHKHSGECETIARGRMADQNFPTIATMLGKRADAVRQKWQACKAALKRAIARGELMLPGRSPDREDDQ